jgi:PAS domain S-box-containing protein
MSTGATMFKQMVRVDPFGANARNSAAHDRTQSLNFTGPLLEKESVILRYGAAVAIVLIVGGLRFALTPLLGSQALLLPFILAVLSTSILAGSGPALLASMLAPALVTPVFMGWPAQAIPAAWWGHVVFFLVIGGAVTHVMHLLQQATRVECAVHVVMHQLECEARLSEARLRSMADALPALVSYIDDSQRYRFANKEHKAWFGVDPQNLIGHHAQQVWGDDAYRTIQPHLETALSGIVVDRELESPGPSECRKIQLHLRPDFAVDGTVKGLFATMWRASNRSHCDASQR